MQEKEAVRTRFAIPDPRFAISLVCALGVLAGEGVSAQVQSTFTEQELRELPRVCLAQPQINLQLRTPVVPPEERARWAAAMGEDYRGFHHYCWALIFLSRGHASSTKQERTFNFRSAVENFAFVQRTASRQFSMMPEVDLRKGMALRLLGEDVDAAREFLDAIRLKPQYTPAYAELFDLYRDLGDMEQAREILERGIALVPDSKILAEKKSELNSNVVSKK